MPGAKLSPYVCRSVSTRVSPLVSRLPPCSRLPGTDRFSFRPWPSSLRSLVRSFGTVDSFPILANLSRIANPALGLKLGGTGLFQHTRSRPDYSYLSTRTGSNPAALRAGMYPASSATAANNAVASAIAAGSFAFTP